MADNVLQRDLNKEKIVPKRLSKHADPQSGRRSFVHVSSTGLVDGKRMVASTGWRGRVVAEKDQGIATAVTCVVARVLDWCEWSSNAAAVADFDEAIKFLNVLKERAKRMK